MLSLFFIACWFLTLVFQRRDLVLSPVLDSALLPQPVFPWQLQPWPALLHLAGQFRPDAGRCYGARQ